MHNHLLGQEQLMAFAQYLALEEKSPGTIEKYRRDTAAFAAWLGNRSLSKETAEGWKAALMEPGLTPATINAKLAAVNKFFTFLDRPEL